MNFNFFNTLILLGTIQGFIFGGAVLFLPKYRSRSNYFLVALIVAVSLNSLQYYLKDVGYISYMELMSVYYIPYATLNCTFLYLYVKCLLFPECKISIKDKLLFIPFLFFIVATSIFKILHVINPLDSRMENNFNNFANFHEIFAVFYSLFLVALSFKIVQNYNKKRQNFNVTIVHQQLVWLKVTLILLFLVIFIYAYLMVKVVLNPDGFVNFYVLWISNSFMIYWLGHLGIYQYGIQKERQHIRKYSLENREDLEVEKKQNTTINAFEKNDC